MVEHEDIYPDTYIHTYTHLGRAGEGRPVVVAYTPHDHTHIHIDTQIDRCTDTDGDTHAYRVHTWAVRVTLGVMAWTPHDHTHIHIDA